ncbi:MAG: isochorismatase family cysteine hydrolase [Anaeromyxobacter sp.]
MRTLAALALALSFLPGAGARAAEPVTALLVIDVQGDYFAGGKLPLQAPEAAARNAAALITLFRARHQPVIHVQHASHEEWEPFLEGTPGQRIHDLVKPAPGEPVVVKGKPSAFAGTGLGELLERLGAARVIIAGMQTNVCVQATAEEADARGLHPVVVRDATAARNPALSAGALERLAGQGIAITTTAALTGQAR